MKKTFTLFIILLFAALAGYSQVYLGSTTNDIILKLGDDYTRVTDEQGTEVLGYFTEINSHPVFGNFTLYTFYLFENDRCVMQQTLVPASQKGALLKNLDETYQRESDMVWKTKKDSYYIVTETDDVLRTQIVSGPYYRERMQRLASGNN